MSKDALSLGQFQEHLENMRKLGIELEPRGISLSSGLRLPAPSTEMQIYGKEADLVANIPTESGVHYLQAFSGRTDLPSTSPGIMFHVQQPEESEDTWEWHGMSWSPHVSYYPEIGRSRSYAVTSNLNEFSERVKEGIANAPPLSERARSRSAEFIRELASKPGTEVTHYLPSTRSAGRTRLNQRRYHYSAASGLLKPVG